MDESWREDALCAQVDIDLFFPDQGASTTAAKSICRSCDVRAECLKFSLDTNQRTGIWGGLSARERQRLIPNTKRISLQAEQIIELHLDGIHPVEIADILGVSPRTVRRVIATLSAQDEEVA